MAKTSSISYNRGTTYTIGVQYSNSNGVLGTTAMFTVKANPGYDSDATDAAALVKHDITLTANVGTITLAPGDIADTFDPGTYYYDLKVLDANSAIYLINTGKFLLDVTPTNRLT